MPPPVAIPRQTPNLSCQGSYGSHLSGGSYGSREGGSGMGYSLGSAGSYGRSWGSQGERQAGERTSSAQRIREDRRERSHSREWQHRGQELASASPSEDVDMGMSPRFGAVDPAAPFGSLFATNSAGSSLASPGGGGIHEEFMMMMDDDDDGGGAL